MFDWIGDGIETFWRSISWDAMSFIINLLKSFVKDIILPFSNLSFLNNEFVKTGFNAFQKVAIPLLAFAVIMQVIIHTVKTDLPDHLKKIMIGTVLAMIVIVGVKPVTDFLNTKAIEVAVTLTTDGDVKSLDDSLTISFIQGANNGIDHETAKSFVEDIKKPDFDYNAKHTEGDNKGDYKYTLNLFSTLAIGIIMLFLLVYVAFQILMRGISLAFLVLFSPFASITLVLDDSQGWKYTQSQIVHNLVMNLFQLYILLFAIKFMSITDEINAFGKVLIIIVSLLFVIQTPQMMAGMFRGQASSLMSTAQSALMGANAGRALTMGLAGAGLATLGSFGNGIRGAFAGSGKGMLGMAGNAVNSSARFAKSSLTGNDKTIFGRQGKKSNEWGAKFHNTMKSSFGGGSSDNASDGTGGSSTAYDNNEMGSTYASNPINDNTHVNASSSGTSTAQSEKSQSSSINEKPRPRASSKEKHAQGTQEQTHNTQTKASQSQQDRQAKRTVSTPTMKRIRPTQQRTNKPNNNNEE